MSASITTMKDPEGNVLYPKTKTDAIYDGSSNRLDQTLTSIQGDLGSKSSASAVAGNDAFSKISTLNSELTNKTRTAITGSSALYTINQSSQYIESYYLIRSGFVFVNVSITCVTPKTSGYEAIASLPLPAAFTTINPPVGYSDNGFHWLFQSGTLYVQGGTANKIYTSSFCYPAN